MTVDLKRLTKSKSSTRAPACGLRAWFCTELGDGITAIQPQAHIEALFDRYHADAGYPVDMAVFTAQESEGRLQCEVMAYFTPSAAALAREVGAGPCPRPSPRGLSLVAGVDAVWAAVFPRSGHE